MNLVRLDDVMKNYHITMWEFFMTSSNLVEENGSLCFSRFQVLKFSFFFSAFVGQEQQLVITITFTFIKAWELCGGQEWTTQNNC